MRALRAVVGLAIGNYAAIAVSFVVNVYLARTLGPGEFGRLAILLLVSQVLSFVASYWTITALIHFGAREFSADGTVARALWTRTVLLLPWLGAAILLVVTARDALAAFLAVPPLGVWIVVGHFLASTLFGSAGAALQAAQRMAQYGAALLLDKAIALSLLVALRGVLVLDALVTVVVFSAGTLAASTWALMSLGARSLRPALPTRDRLGEMWRFSLPLIASTWMGFFGSQWVDLAILRRYVPLSDVGLYALSYQLAGVVQQITVIVATYVLPRYSVLVSEGRDDELRRILTRIVPYWLLGLSASLSVALWLAGPLVPLLFGADFEGSAAPFALLGVATICLAIFNSFNPVVIAYGATWWVSGAVLLSVSANVVLDLVLIPVFGIRGAASATVVAYALSAAATAAVAGRRLGLNASRYALFALPVLSTYLGVTVLSGVLSAVATALAIAVGSAVVVRAFDLFRPEERGLLARARPR